jgi:cytochrome c oxidase assembly factor 6
MALEAYASPNPDTVHTDVLSEARQACYKVVLFLFLSSSLCSRSAFVSYLLFNFFILVNKIQARDAFYSCLEKESNKTPTEIASVGLLYPSDCKGSRAEFVKHCRASWVKQLPFFQSLIHL